MDAKCAHVKYENYYATMKRKKKLIQFASIFLLLNKIKLMTDYESFKVLFDFLTLKKNSNFLKSEFAGWEMANYIHNQVMATLKKAMINVSYVSLTIYKTTSMDNQNYI
jgi:hypothetical protein